MGTVRKENGRHRAAIFERDGGYCALCGVDTLRLQVWLQSIPHLNSLGTWKYGRHDRFTAPTFSRVLGRHRSRAVTLLGRLWNVAIPSAKAALWQMDHVVPVIEGGGECGLDGLRTLCLRCHRVETAALAGRLARRPSKGIGRG